MPHRNSTFLRELGPGGASSLLLALGSGVLGLGIPVAVRLREVLRRASGDEIAAADVILVLGRELRDDRPTAAFRARLDHAVELWRDRWAPTVVVSGGWTGTARRSEAAAGREHLIERGLPTSAVWTEERSRHTLENLFYVRETLRSRELASVILVSDPLHLARAGALACGLGIDLRCSPAVAAPPGPGSAGWCLRAAREAFLLHWYRVGLVWSRLLRSKRMLSRVT